jgi:hypothetical protein
MGTKGVICLAALLAVSFTAGCGGPGGEEGDGDGDDRREVAGAGAGGGGAVTGPTMRPGENCLGCHAFTAAGTVYADASGALGLAGAAVQLSDGQGRSVALTTNAAGNFFTSAALTAPLAVTVSAGGSSRSMQGARGSCNGCHTGGGTPRIHP